MRLDLNSIINVELTEYGEKELFDYYYLIKGYSVREIYELINKRLNDNGTYKFTLLEFVKIFGDNNIANVYGCIDSINVDESKKREKKL